MKRNIKDYEGLKVAIYCSSLKEWDKIKALINSKEKTTREYGDRRAEDNNNPTDHIHINGKGTSTKKLYEENNYTIYSAKDFLEEAYDLQNQQLIFKEGDWVYAEKSDSGDWRIDKYIPLFQVKEIKHGYLRPEKDVATGINIEFCRKALSHEIPVENACKEVPKYVKCTDPYDNRFIKGKIYINTSTNNKLVFVIDGKNNYPNGNDYPYEGGLWKFKPSTEAEYLAQESNKIHETTNYHKVDMFFDLEDKPIKQQRGLFNIIKPYSKIEFPTANRIIYSEKKQIKLTELEIPKPIKIFKR